ncbi:hypothetical protein BH11PAT3_BH11PAT3_2980 [soil metagenome]
MPYRMRSLMIFAGLMLIAQTASAQAHSTKIIPTGCVHHGKDECVTKAETAYVAAPALPPKTDTVTIVKDRPVPQYINVPVEVPRNDRSWKPTIVGGLLGAAALGTAAYFISKNSSTKVTQCVAVNAPPACRP